MKKIMTFVVAGLLTIGISFAQDSGSRQKRTPEEMAKAKIERLTEQLALSQTQQDSIYKYALLASKEQRELMKSAGDNREATFEKMRVLRDNSDKKIKTFLTAEQLKKYEDEVKNNPQAGRRRAN